MATTEIDSGLIRRALRVIHCLQRERGASGAYCASSDEPSGNHAFQEDAISATSSIATSPSSRRTTAAPIMSKHQRTATVNMPLTTARVDTDRALGHMVAHCKYASAHSSTVLTTTQLTLQKIRSMMDRQDDLVPSFRRILVSFSTLISTVIHEFVLRYTVTAALNKNKILKADGTSSGFPRVASSGNLIQKQLQQQQHAKKRAPNHRRSRSFGDANDDRTGLSSDPLLQHYSSDPAHFVFDWNQSDTKKGVTIRTPLPRLQSGQQLGFLSQSATQTPNSDGPSSEFIEENRGRVKRLLSLLGIFVQLKESTGVERATLTSMLVFQQQQDANLLLNDVVLEVENQRRQVMELQSQVRPGPLRNLVLELITMSPELRQVQESLLTGFSLDALREQFNADQLWDVMTLYIDKLHSLELLIVEEMEAAKDRVDNAPTFDLSGVWKGAFGIGNATDSAEDLLRSIEALSADEVKKRLVSELRKDPTVRNGMPDRTKKNVDDLLQELSNAPASKEWEIGIYELRFLKRIGQGSAGTTYIADWSGLKVAVKVASITEMGLEGWRTEVQALQKLHHPNIIRLLGSVYHPHPLTFCLVLEYCDAGDLQSAILKVNPGNFFFHVASSIAKGIAYLHNRSIIHRDIKPSNVLLHGDLSSGNYQVKVTDFGVSTDLNSVRDRTAETGTYRWMSPEVIRHENYSQTADVYSYAIVLWQLVTRDEPFADKSQIEAAIQVSMENARPPLPPGIPKAVSDLLQKAWAEKPHERPSFDEIVELLTDIESSLTDKERRWLEAPLGHHVYRRLQINEYSHGVDINTLDLEIPQANVKESMQAKKRGKKFSLFSRKSSHF